MNDTILRKAHMSAITEIATLKNDMRRLENAIMVANCINQYLAARLQLHGKPYNTDVGILRLGQVAIGAKSIKAAEVAMGALSEMMKLVSKYTNEAIAEERDRAEFDANHFADEATADEIVRRVLASVDQKMLKYKEEQMRAAGMTAQDLEDLRRAVEEQYGLGDKDFE